MGARAFYLNHLRAPLHSAFLAIPGKRPIFDLARRIGTPPPALARWLRFKGNFEVNVGDRKLRLRSDGEHVETSLYWAGLYGEWEKESLKLWSQLCADAEVVLDIGANTGIYSLVAKAIRPKARVWGFEPIPRIRDKFVANCRLNDFTRDIHCEPYAISNTDGKAKIYDPGGHVYSVTLNENHNEPGVKAKETEVETLTLESFIERNGLDRIDVIKLDVEGHEPEALEGMGPFLARMKPTLLVEITSDELARRIESLVTGLGYLYFDIDEKTRPQRVPRLAKSAKWNFLLCQPEVAARIGLATF